MARPASPWGAPKGDRGRSGRLSRVIASRVDDPFGRVSDAPREAGDPAKYRRGSDRSGGDTDRATRENSSRFHGVQAVIQGRPAELPSAEPDVRSISAT